MLSFTAEEIWSALPAPVSGEREESAQLSEWYTDFPQIAASEFNDAYWRSVMEAKEAVNGALEKARGEKRIGASLSAEVVLFAADELKAKLDRLGDELRFVLITSGAVVKSLSEEGGEATDLDGLRVAVMASDAEKCERCWHHSETVGSDERHPTLCGRCVENVEGDGEVRHYA